MFEKIEKAKRYIVENLAKSFIKFSAAPWAVLILFA